MSDYRDRGDAITTERITLSERFTLAVVSYPNGAFWPFVLDAQDTSGEILNPEHVRVRAPHENVGRLPARYRGAERANAYRPVRWSVDLTVDNLDPEVWDLDACKRALAATCSTCGAATGQLCKTSGGWVARPIHKPRRELAKA